MTFEQFLDSIPDYAKDLKQNLGATLQQTELTPTQAWGTAVSCAITSRSPRMLQAISEAAAKQMTPATLSAAKTAAAIMGMNNIFYRFRHLSGNPRYSELPARLRMQSMRTHGANELDFELWCLAVSAINGCGACVEGHEQSLREKGVNEEMVLAAMRIASTVFALSAVVEADPTAV